ncbi:hypothetical protein FKR81_10960 [Lentzea tibetensis]|uniref:Knr4/Smi1-like domain-containing protein n=1 Tax=Lentzea tibetensis TaxID=2591470 RepID=A0A563EWL6_9PSEU|nr:SMI1/KNR4 family protein [Lentzea tibetensis]TWP52095.1 hypothetical protein FKR81_10960 [Lentzea tibetensis]
MENHISRIRSKLARAAAVPSLLESGGRRHLFRLNPPLSEEDVAWFEESREVTLPEAYRRFVLELGDGGAGPGLRMVPLHEAHDWDDLPHGFLATPSGLAPGTAHTRDWHDYPELRQGTLAVADLDCEYITQLVVTGPARGRLVNVNLAGWTRPVFAEDPDFLSWYERWLDELLAGWGVSLFGNKIPGDEPVLVDVLAHDPSADRRARAARSLISLPSIGQAGADVLAASIRDQDPAVRAAALLTAGAKRVAACEAPAREALTDPVADVRVQALLALHRLEPADLADRVRERLGDEEPAVARQAIYALKELGGLTAGDLEPLTTHPNPDLRNTAIRALRAAVDG